MQPGKWRGDIDSGVKGAQHGTKPLTKVVANRVQQEGLRAKPIRAGKPRAQSGMVEQFWGGSGVHHPDYELAEFGVPC